MNKESFIREYCGGKIISRRESSSPTKKDGDVLISVRKNGKNKEVAIVFRNKLASKITSNGYIDFAFSESKQTIYFFEGETDGFSRKIYNSHSSSNEIRIPYDFAKKIGVTEWVGTYELLSTKIEDATIFAIKKIKKLYFKEDI